jgi:hypothetical protein
VADPFASVEAPRVVPLEPIVVLAASPHEILVAKLTALLGRSEIRDLVDVRALLEAGGDVDRALSDAPRTDASFSAMTLAWVLDSSRSCRPRGARDGPCSDTPRSVSICH